MTVSVVIPVYNGATVLAQQLESLVRERSRPGSPPFEVVIADNGSSDTSVVVARSYAGRLDLRVVDADDRRGQAHARNVGASAASHELLLFLDQDDEVGPGYIATMAAALCNQSFVAARMDCVALNPGWRQHVRTLAQTSALADGPDGARWGYGCTLGIRRPTFEALGGFDADLPVRAGEDVEFCTRAHAAGVKLAFVPDAVLHYRFPHRLGSILRQGHTYGLAGAYVEERAGRRTPSSFTSTVRAMLGPLRLIIIGPSIGTRAHGLFLLGRALGAGRTRRQFGSAAPAAALGSSDVG